ncbi:MAG: class I SAM-dependent methyltransferase [Nocardioides sp.]|nr:class I SAM-dependent methyltransferase [Nocardioides sp.]
MVNVVESGMASSFGTVAPAYAELRPDYAAAAVRSALSGVSPGQVLDLGAGTGKLSAVLAAVGADVVAVEPDPAMLAELRRSLPAVEAVSGSAESIPLPDASVTAVLAGHALHWFDMAMASPEIRRVLRPGGVLAGLWNVYDDQVDWVRGLADVAGPAAVGPRDLLSSWRDATAGLLLDLPGFAGREVGEHPHGQRHTAASLTAALATRAGMLVMAEPERRTVLDRIRAYLAGRPETTSGEFTLPMRTGVLRTSLAVGG